MSKLQRLGEKEYKQEFKGLIVRFDVQEGGIFIVPAEGHVSTAFANQFPNRAFASVRYAISTNGDWPETLDEVAADTIAILEGAAQSKYYHRYSDLTGYLWTEEAAVVGGHDLVSMLQFNVGKYLWMEVTYKYE